MANSEKKFENHLEAVELTEAELLLWIRSVAYINFSNLTGQPDRTRLLAIAAAAGEYCLKNGHSFAVYLEILNVAGCPRPE